MWDTFYTISWYNIFGLCGKNDNSNLVLVYFSQQFFFFIQAFLFVFVYVLYICLLPFLLFWCYEKWQNTKSYLSLLFWDMLPGLMRIETQDYSDYYMVMNCIFCC